MIIYPSRKEVTDYIKSVRTGESGKTSFPKSGGIMRRIVKHYTQDSSVAVAEEPDELIPLWADPFDGFWLALYIFEQQMPAATKIMYNSIKYPRCEYFKQSLFGRVKLTYSIRDAHLHKEKARPDTTILGMTVMNKKGEDVITDVIIAIALDQMMARWSGMVPTTISILIHEFHAHLEPFLDYTVRMSLKNLPSSSVHYLEGRNANDDHYLWVGQIDEKAGGLPKKHETAISEYLKAKEALFYSRVVAYRDKWAKKSVAKGLAAGSESEERELLKNMIMEELLIDKHFFDILFLYGQSVDSPAMSLSRAMNEDQTTHQATKPDRIFRQPSASVSSHLHFPKEETEKYPRFRKGNPP